MPWIGHLLCPKQEAQLSLITCAMLEKKIAQLLTKSATSVCNISTCVSAMQARNVYLYLMKSYTSVPTFSFFRWHQKICLSPPCHGCSRITD